MRIESALRGLKGLVTLGLVLGVAIGCGSTGPDSNSGTSRLSWKEQLQEELNAAVIGPAHSFTVPGVVNGPVFFGHEASAPERKQASQWVLGWMGARSKAAWAKDCSFLSQTYKRYVVKDANFVTNGRARNCPQALAYFGAKASGNLVNTTTGPIDSLRIKGTRGYALYHGRNGIDWSVTMEREKGKWKVAQPLPEALNDGRNAAPAPRG